MKTAFFVTIAVTSLIALSIVASSLASPANKKIEKLFDDYSLNWAGYYVSGNTYTYATATWTVPTIQTTNSGYSSAWVGIGGVNGNGNLIQTGTEQDCASGSTTGGEMKYHGLDQTLINKPIDSASKTNGGKSSSCKPVYYAWWEIYPTNAEQKITTMTVSPGDVMTAFVQQLTPGVWTISITDVTKGQSFSTQVTFSPDQTTAESIIERPALCTIFNCKLTNLANFGTMTFSNSAAQTSSNYFNSFSNAPITMLDNSFKIMAQPGSLASSGTFSVTWFRSS